MSCTPSSFHSLCSACAWNSRLSFPALVSDFLVCTLNNYFPLRIHHFLDAWRCFRIITRIYWGYIWYIEVTHCRWGFCRYSLWKAWEWSFYTDTMSAITCFISALQIWSPCLSLPFYPCVIASQTSTFLFPELTLSCSLHSQEKLWAETCPGKQFTQPQSAIYPLFLNIYSVQIMVPVTTGFIMKHAVQSHLISRSKQSSGEMTCAHIKWQLIVQGSL